MLGWKRRASPGAEQRQKPLLLPPHCGDSVPVLTVPVASSGTGQRLGTLSWGYSSRESVTHAFSTTCFFLLSARFSLPVSPGPLGRPRQGADAWRWLPDGTEHPPTMPAWVPCPVPKHRAPGPNLPCSWPDPARCSAPAQTRAALPSPDLFYLFGSLMPPICSDAR